MKKIYHQNKKATYKSNIEYLYKLSKDGLYFDNIFKLNLDTLK